MINKSPFPKPHSASASQNLNQQYKLAEGSNVSSGILVHAENLYLSVPVFKPSEQKLTANPLHLISNFYLNKSQRNDKTLLSNINFTLHKGERLGLIGPNGAGKTTLLRVISGVYRPSSGILDVNGTTQGIFNIQMGMNNAATGVENIYLRGLQMGMTLSEIRAVTKSVTEFADIGSAINDLFGSYSTGMRLRLAAAISTMIKPDILIMDEWIGSGDLNFKEKLQARMNMLVDDSRGLVIATHAVPLMKSLCTHGLVLIKGKIVFFGPIEQALTYYLTFQAKDN